MDRCLVLVPTLTGPHPAVEQHLTAIEKNGTQVIRNWGCSDIALARNTLLTIALDLADSLAAAADPSGQCTLPELDTVIFVDGDVVPEPVHVKRLVQRSRETGHAVSAVYVTADGRLTANEYPNSDRWLVGMGCCAIPLVRLRQLTRTLPGRVKASPHHNVWPFCVTGPNHETGNWEGEDFSLSRALCGVIIEPVAVEHFKTVPITPDEESMEELRNTIAARTARENGSTSMEVVRG